MEFVRVEIITAATKLNGFKKAIAKLGVTGMTVSQVMGCGVQKGTMEYEDEIHEDIELIPKQMIMMVMEKDKLKKVLDVIKKELYTGHIGDGKIFVSEITNIIIVATSCLLSLGQGAGTIGTPFIISMILACTLN